MREKMSTRLSEKDAQIKKILTDEQYKLYQEKQKAQLERANYAAWLSGIYVTHSIAASLGENARYPEKPIDLYETEEDLESRKAREAELFSAYVDMFNKNFESRK